MQKRESQGTLARVCPTCQVCFFSTFPYWIGSIMRDFSISPSPAPPLSPQGLCHDLIVSR